MLIMLIMLIMRFWNNLFAPYHRGDMFFPYYLLYPALPQPTSKLEPPDPLTSQFLSRDSEDAELLEEDDVRWTERGERRRILNGAHGPRHHKDMLKKTDVSL